MLNPIHPRTLRECLSTGSFAEAARNLGYAASVVSQQMFLPERTLGTALFERSARSVRATAVAKLLADRGGAVLGADHLPRQRLRRGPRPGVPGVGGGDAVQANRHVLVLHRENNSNPLLPLALDCLAQASDELAREW